MGKDALGKRSHEVTIVSGDNSLEGRDSSRDLKYVQDRSKRIA